MWMRTSYMLAPVALLGLMSLVPAAAETTARSSLWSAPVAGLCAAICTDCVGGGHATVEGSDDHPLHEVPLECYADTCGSHPCDPSPKFGPSSS